MDPLHNPFAPGAGTPPPQLAGREVLLADAQLALDRVRLRRPARSQIFVGLRGVGKTVLLNRIREMAEVRQFRTSILEAHEDTTIPGLLIPPLRRILFSLDTAADISEKTKRGLRVLRSFLGKFSSRLKVGDLADLEFGFEPERGAADSGILESDLSDLFIAVSEAAAERNSQICLLLDEMQYLAEPELGALIMALHQVNQRNLPLILVGAGLPQIPALAGRSKSYAERLFTYPPVGALAEAAARDALSAPVQAQGAAWTGDALLRVLAETDRYPYFLQQWGYECWNAAAGPVIGIEDVAEGSRRAIAELDQSFFRVRFDRLTPREKDYLFAMGTVGGDKQRSGDIAEQLGIRTTSLGPLRSSLIAKGMIYSPSHGGNAFTVPLFGEFLKRQAASPG
jgi:hypothetical protein